MYRINEISTLSKLDYIKILSTLYAYDNRRFDCNHCLKLYVNRADREMMLKKERDQKACQRINETPIHKIGETLQFKTCIGNFYSDSVGYLVAAFSKFEDGVMPYAGAYLDQPAKIIQAFDVISAWKADKIKASQMADKARAQGKLLSGNRRR